MYNPHSNRGRRPTARPAPSARAAQLREAQRLHRERKRVYIEDLERRARAADDALARVAMLERQLLQPGKAQVADNNDGGDASHTVEHYLAGINSDGIPVHSPNHSSQLRQEDNQKEHQQMYPKDEHLREHQLQHQQSRRRQWRFHPAYAFVPAARAFAAPSTASLEIRFAKLSLLAIPSLAESPNIVSRFCAVLRELVDSADRRHLRATLSDTVAAAFAIIDRCSVLEKTAALDVFASLIKANQEIYTYLNKMWAWRSNRASPVPSAAAKCPDISRMPKDAQSEHSDALFIKNLKSIDSLSNLESLEDSIDELVCLFEVMQVNNNRGRHFIRVMEINHDLATQCATVRELAKFLAMSEIGRQVAVKKLLHVVDFRGVSWEDAEQDANA
ncbi:hypothetical protein HDU83_007921 [Entophlyctis luteolus]|nr:hypothetical protein HDU82_001766 [Entophlyctis luteolus]KAJ3338752.1 hypothetical protein HDU83_007921 [Entophlyctis luteolus]